MERKGMVLESEIRTVAISEGYDPTAGIMHEGARGWQSRRFRRARRDQFRASRESSMAGKRTVLRHCMPPEPLMVYGDLPNRPRRRARCISDKAVMILT
jgi:hypothetical protein